MTNLNSLYIIVTVVIILGVTFQYIDHSNEKRSNCDIAIDIDSEIVLMNINTVINYLVTVRHDLTKLNNISATKSLQLNVDKSIQNMNNFIYAESFKAPELENSREYQSLFTKMRDTTRGIERSDENDTDEDKFKHQLIKAIALLDVVLCILQHKQYVGVLTITSLNNLVSATNKISKHRSYDEANNNDSDNDVHTNTEPKIINYTKAHMKSFNSVGSERDELVNCSNILRPNNEIKKKRCTTISAQDFEHSLDSRSSNGSIVPAKSSNKINKIRADNEKLRKLFVDDKCRQSLRNDYDF
jgi:hypothetical protein